MTETASAAAPDATDFLPTDKPDLRRCPAEWASYGGSNVACLDGIDPFCTHTDLYLRLGWGIGAAETDAMRVGKRAEPYILAALSRLHGVVIDGGGTWRGSLTAHGHQIPVRHQADGIGVHNGDLVIGEAKWTSRHNSPWTIDPDVCPAHYVAQVNWGMGWRKIQRAFVAMAWGFGDDEITIWEVLFDAAMFARQQALVAKHYIDHFVPDLDGNLYPWTPVNPEAHAALAKAMWPRVRDEVIETVTGTDAELVIAAAKAHEAKGKVEKEWDAYKDTLTAMIGPREGVRAGGTVWTYKGAKNNPEKRTLRRKEHADGK